MVQFDDGTWGGSRLNQLRAGGGKWAEEWNVTDAHEAPTPEVWERELEQAASIEAPYAMPLLDELREAALSFPRRTGISLEGIPVRHLDLLPDEALVVLAILIALIEALGSLPSQVQRLLIFLIPKVTGGRRSQHASSCALSVVGKGAKAACGSLGASA